jgi:hypothetical protein
MYLILKGWCTYYRNKVIFLEILDEKKILEIYKKANDNHRN